MDIPEFRRYPSLSLAKEREDRGGRDLWSYWTKDSPSFDWESAGKPENASRHVFMEKPICVDQVSARQIYRGDKL